MKKRNTKRIVRPMRVPAFILGSLPVSSYAKHLRTLRLTRHGALRAIADGQGSDEHVELVLASLNVSESLAVFVYEGSHVDEIRAAKKAMEAMVGRLSRVGKYIWGVSEHAAVCRAFEVHDAQLDDCSVLEIDAARKYVEKLVRDGAAKVLETQAA